MFGEWRARADGSAEQSVTVPGRPDALAGAEEVTYTTTFSDPREGLNEAAVLALRGLYAHAEIEVSCDRLDGDGPVETDAYFQPVRLPLRPAPETELTVTCRAPRDRFGGLHDTDRVPEHDRVPGIWWDASLSTHPLPFVDRLRVRPEVTDDGAVLHVRTTVVSDGPLDERITYSLRPAGDHAGRGTMDRRAVESEGGGTTTVEHAIEVRDPALWWPRDLGDQHRYTLRAKLGESERTVTTGIREIERDGGRLVVNGQPMPVRGVTLLTADGADVERATELNANLVRATAHVLPREVYEACDEAGLLVWQDLPLTGPGSFDVERGRELVGLLDDAYGRHPSLAAVGVHDEPTDAFQDGLGDGLLDRLRLRWRAWRTDYDRGPAEEVADAVPDRYAAIPVVGGPGVDHDAAAYYPGWDYGTPETVASLLARYPADLLAAFGAGALADDGTADAAGFDARKHDARVAGGVEESQAYQADLLRTVAGTARRRGLGVVAHALRDTDGAGMGVYAVDGTPKAARDALATTLQPVQALLADPSPGPSDVVVVNDAPASLSGTLSWEAGDSGGTMDVTVDATGRWSDQITLPDDADEVRLVLSVRGGRVENAYEI